MPEAKKKILIVDDDMDVSEMLNAYFNIQGYEVANVQWGQDGVEACQKNRPDIVILDIHLPDIDGYEVARRLRNNRRLATIPIIFLAQANERSDRLQGLEMGADDYIAKPFDVQELLLRIRNALHRAEQDNLINPVSGLPDGTLVDEHLAEAFKRDGWSMLVISLENMDHFRETYGFVASDDVLRATSLMVHNCVKELGGKDDFLGHLGSADFILITDPTHAALMIDRIRTRLLQSLEYFYPIKDRDTNDMRHKKLAVRTGELQAGEIKFTSTDDLKTALLRTRH